MSRYHDSYFYKKNKVITKEYMVYRESNGQFLGTVDDCISENEAVRKGEYKYGCSVYVNLIK